MHGLYARRQAGEQKWRSYFPIYERHLAPFVNKTCTLVEVGVFDAHSFPLWHEYLGGDLQLHGIDLNPGCAQYQNGDLATYIYIGDATDPKFMAECVERIGPIDIVIDDGSHASKDQRETFRLLYPHLSDFGVYIVEDLCLNYDEGQRHADSFVEDCKRLVDEVNSAFLPDPATFVSRNTNSIHFYEGVVVFERGRPILRRVLGDRYMRWQGMYKWEMQPRRKP